MALVARATGTLPNTAHLALLLVGAVAMRGAGSTLNDIADRDIDRQVERTRGRPIASGRVSRFRAALFLAAQALLGLAVVLCFNRFTVLLACASLAVVAIYPFAKRVTSWPQAVLGLAFAWGALVGWAATADALSAAPVLLFAGAVFWTIGYDTIYALQDRADDAIVGIGSTALFFGPHVRGGVAALYAVAALCTGAAVLLAGGGPLSWLGTAAFALHLGWQVARIDLEDGPRSHRLFRSNRIAGLVLFAGLAADAVLHAV